MPRECIQESKSLLLLEGDVDHGKKKKGKFGILYGVHLGHRGVQYWNILSIYLFLFSMVIDS